MRSSILPLSLILVLCAAANLGAEVFSCAGYSPPTLPPGVAARLTGGQEKRFATGRVHALVIFARFEDETAQAQTPPTFAADLFDPDLPGSFTHFYHTMSQGQLDAGGTALPRRYRSEQPAAAYQTPELEKNGEYGQFVLEILEKVDRDVDFGLFDNDGPDGIPNSGDDDGVVDYVFVNVLSTPRGFLRGAATGMANLGFALYETADRGFAGKPIHVNGTIAHGAIQREGNFAQTVGSMAHEFGHRLGLPDLYDLKYRSPAEDSAGIGGWGLMGWGAHGWDGTGGPVAFSAWSLEQLGWIGVDNQRLVEAVRDTTGLVVEDVLQGGSIYRIPLRIEDGGRYWLEEEYLLLEQLSRASSYYRRHIPAEGLLVWHVRSQTQTNIDERGKVVDLVCADGLYQDAGYPAGGKADGMHGRDNLDFWAHDAAYTREHGGNLGDATDPFDGDRFTRLELGTNPSTNPQGLISPASTGLSLEMRRQGAAMVVDVAQPRWAGTIRDKVHWAGPVVVDGDLLVAPEGRLVIHESAQVLFDGADRLRSGRDLERNELEIRGDLVVGVPVFSHEHQREDVVFKALNPGETWYGIHLDPVDSSDIELPEGSYQLFDVEHGFLFSGAPSGVPELKVNREYRIADAPSLETAGNGDGQLSAGESFQVGIEVGNWSLNNYPWVEVSVEWPTSQVSPTWSPEADVQSPYSLPVFSLVPGGERDFLMPSLTLSPDVQSGQEIEFSIRLDTGSWTRSDRLSLTVADLYPVHEAVFAVPGLTIRNHSVWAPADRPTSIRVQTRGEVEAVDLVVRTVRGLEPVIQIPTQRQVDVGEDEGAVFEGAFQPPAAGQYMIFPRIRSGEGAVVFSDSHLFFWATPFAEQPPVLVFPGDHHEDEEDSNALRQILSEVLNDLSLRAHFLDIGRQDGIRYQDLLPHYVGEQQLVVWLGETLDEEAQEAFGQFMKGGGRLFIASAGLQKSPAADPFVRHMLHSRERSWLRPGTVRGVYPDESVEFETDYVSLKPLAPAEPVLVDGRGQAAGLRLDNGAFRLVYLPFDLRGLPAEVRHFLVESGLRFLHPLLKGALEIPGHENTGQLSIVTPGRQTPVRARVDAAVESAVLVVRSGPSLELVAEVPMQPAGQEKNGESIFEASFLPVEQGRYHLSLQLQNADGGFSSSGLWALSHSTERPVLLMAGKNYGDAVKGAVQEALGQHLEASVMDLIEEDEAFYDALLDRYLEEGDLVIWLGDMLSERARDTFRRFVAKGGRLLMASRRLPSSPGVDAFLSDVLRVGARRLANTKEIYSAGSLTGPLFEFSANHLSLDLLAPAAPMLVNAEGQAAGLGVDDGTGRLVYWPFDLWRMNGASIERLVEASLPFLLEGPLYEAVLELPDSEMLGDVALLDPHRGNAIGAWVKGAAESAGLVVRTYPDMEVVAELPMALSSKRGDELEFEVEFQLPGPEQYQLSLQLYDANGRAYQSAANLRVIGLSLSTQRPVLVFVHESIKTEIREPMLADLTKVLRGQGLEADIVTRAPMDETLYASLLDHYRDEGDLVVWIGQTLEQEAQVVFQRFAEQGGRLLMASLDFRQSPNFAEFMRNVFHARIQRRSRSGTGFGGPLWPDPRAIFMRYRVLEPLLHTDSTIEPVLLDKNDRALGLQVDTGARRAVFLSFDLKNVESLARREILAANIAFLHQHVTGKAQLSMGNITHPAAIAALSPLAPQFRVSNTGNEASEYFRVGYQVLLEDQVVAAIEQEEAPLEGEAQREISLPVWEPPQAGMFRIRFGMSATPDGELVYASDQALRIVDVTPPFEEITLPGEVSHGNGAGFFDSDGDGDLDFYLVRLGAANELYRNDGEEFTEQAAAAGIADDGWGRGLAVGDYDGDEDLDLYLVNEQANRFFRNEGDGSFADITAAPLADASSGRSAGFFDYDNDGDVDLYLVNATGANRLFRNERGSFSERAMAAGIADAGNGRGLAVGDYDGDGDADLYVVNQSGQLRSQLYRNDTVGSDGLFTGVSAELELRATDSEVAAVFGDYDNDGDPDLFVSDQSAANVLWRNDGMLFNRVVGEDPLALGGGTVGAAFNDYDNDGDLDLATTALSPQSGGDELYHNLGAKLVPVGALLGLSPVGSGRGLSFADYDGDGNADLLVADSRHSRLYRNNNRSKAAAAAHWLQVDLQGPGFNRHALGARVEVLVDDALQYREVQSGYGYGSQVQPRVHFGLGAAAQADTLRVIWPDGQETIQTDVRADRLLRVAHPGQGAAVLEEQPWPLVFELWENYPNPFNPQTTISYQLPNSSGVKLSIYNMAGQRIKRLVDEHKPAGYHQISWDGTDEAGYMVGSGVYVYHLEAGGNAKTRRLLLLK